MKNENNHPFVKCNHCGSLIEEKPKKNFLGFSIYTCPKCSKKSQYPLSSTYKIIYYVLTGVFVLGILQFLSTGSGGISLFGGLALIALIQDWNLRKRIN